MPPPPEWMVLVDLGLPDGMDPQRRWKGCLRQGSAAGLVLDGVIATSEAQRAEFWALRESIPEANRRIGAVSSHDISLPLGEIARFRGAKRGLHWPTWAIGGSIALAIWAMAICITTSFRRKGQTRAEYENQREAIKTVVHDLAHALGGSVSAEHGIGRLKVDDLERYGDPAKLAAMRAIKAALDPKGIMNPGAILRG